VFFCPYVGQRGFVLQLIRFFQEAYQELKLSSWLSRQQMMGSTVVVIILTLIMAAYVSLIDRVLLFLAGILFRIG
jgi:preprotein translocase SecE subunit